MTGTEGFKYQASTVKEMQSILLSSETSLQWAAPHLTLMHSFPYIDARPTTIILYFPSHRALLDVIKNKLMECGYPMSSALYNTYLVVLFDLRQEVNLHEVIRNL